MNRKHITAVALSVGLLSSAVVEPALALNITSLARTLMAVSPGAMHNAFSATLSSSTSSLRGRVREDKIMMMKPNGLPMITTVFAGEVHFSLPDSGLGIDNLVAAKTAKIALTLIRDEKPFAACLLRFDRAIPNPLTQTLRVQYHVAIEKMGSHHLSEGGGCDINLSKAGIQRGLPMVKAGDHVQVMLMNPGPMPEASATFRVAAPLR